MTKFADSFSEEIWDSTYRYHPTDDTVDGTFKRVGRALAQAEKPEEQYYWAEVFTEAMEDFKVMMGGRIYANAGAGYEGTTLMNCFVGPKSVYDVDSLEEIINEVKRQALTLKSEGGWGNSFDTIRPRGTMINGIGVETPGAVKYMEIYDKVSDTITAGSGKQKENTGKEKKKNKIRKGACMAVMSVWGPDILEFITAKQTPGRLTKFNMSVNCTDDFMAKVLGTDPDDNWDLRYPDTTHPDYKEKWDGNIKQWEAAGLPVKVYKTVSAKWLWNLITESTYNRAEPGVLFLDRANYYNPLYYGETIAATNPCGEQVLSPGNICCLGSVNLTQFVDVITGEFDYNRFSKYVSIAVRMLDNVNTVSTAPLPEYKWSMENKRRVGVGVSGWGSALLMMRKRFASPEAMEIQHKIATTYAKAAYRTSIELAKERGMFAVCDPEKHAASPFITALFADEPEVIEEIKTYGIRNSSLLSCQPTGTSSIFAGLISGGIEPPFSFGYVRTSIVANIPEDLRPHVPEFWEGKLYETDVFKWHAEGDDKMLRGEFGGYVYKIDASRGLTRETECLDYGVRKLKEAGLWDETADWATTALNLEVDDHVRDLQGWAKFVDSSISKCMAADETMVVIDGVVQYLDELTHFIIEDSFYDYEFNGETLNHRRENVRVNAVYNNGHKDTIRVTFSDGSSVRGTPNHRIFVSGRFVKLRDVKIGMEG